MSDLEIIEELQKTGINLTILEENIFNVLNNSFFLDTDKVTKLKIKSQYLDNNHLNLIFNLVNLSHLELTNVGLKEIPNNIFKLNKLIFLSFYKNSIKEIPIINLLNLKSLSSLYLGLNQIRNIPADIVKLTNLKRLNLRGNKINNVDNLFKLKKLERLSLSGNLISEISNKISDLQKLEFLNMSGNFITILPNDIKKLNSLETLNLTQTAS